MAGMSDTKRISRRNFLKLAGTGAAALSAGALLQACVPATSAPPAAPPAAAAPTSAPAVSTAVPAVAAGGKTLTLAIQAFAHDALKPVIAQWEQKSGNKVTLESGPATGQEMMTKYAPAFQSNTSSVDVISVDDVSAVSYTHLRAHETRHDLVC